MGFWGCRSFDNDAVHDHLCWAGRRGWYKGFDDPGTLTEDQLEKYLINMVQPILMNKKENTIQTALGSMPTLNPAYIFLGLTIWGLLRGFHFQPLVLDAALAAGYILLGAKEDIQRWKNPGARRKNIAKEIFMLTQERPDTYRDQSFVQHNLQKFPWEVGRGMLNEEKLPGKGRR
ncbi:hypothetical protein LCGC14_2885090 [marine sediment metagenome]|uniref:Uncharacterized protein n=1 Tax=marine sediment metagenome TaxID=412755 RepID=A0A0F9AQ16_9ZZZZ